MQRLAGAMLLVAGLSVAWLACDSEPQTASDAAEEVSTPHKIRKLRFAGVNLIYALRRLAAEADLLLALDEIQSGPVSLDLGRFRVDMDLEAGPAAVAVETLKEETQAFDYRIFDNVLYVRSILATTAVTGLDTKDLPAAKLTVDIEELAKWIMRVRPKSYLTTKRTPGEPIFRKVDLDIPESSSVLDVLLMYAKAVDRGWKIRRAGQSVLDAQGRPAIVANSLALWPPLTEPKRLPQFRQKNSTIAALASVSQRTGTPLCIKDRSGIGTIQGWLDFSRKLDPKLPLEESVEGLAWPGARSTLDDYEWEWQDGVIKITTRHYLYYLPGRDLLLDTVHAGTFQGTLPELARWINQNRSTPPRKVLMGGEIIDEGPTAKLEIAEGANVEDVLTGFARSSGSGWNLVIVDALTPDQSEEELPANAWRGAYLTPLDIWLP